MVFEGLVVFESLDMWGICTQKRKKEGGKIKESFKIVIGFAHNCDSCRLGSNGRIPDSASELDCPNDEASCLMISILLCICILLTAIFMVLDIASQYPVADSASDVRVLFSCWLESGSLL